jgi:hypothetical protein
METGFIFFLIFWESKASRFEQREQDKAWSTFRSLHNKKQCYRREEQI